MAPPHHRTRCRKIQNQVRCEVKNYDPRSIRRQGGSQYDLFTQYALIAPRRPWRTRRSIGKIDYDIGSVIGGSEIVLDECGYAEGGMTPRFSHSFIPRMIAGHRGGFISIKYGFIAPTTHRVACASSNHGLIDASNYIAGQSHRHGAAAPRLRSMNPVSAASTRCRPSRPATDDPQHASRRSTRTATDSYRRSAGALS